MAINATFPAGIYFIGDLCYVHTPQEWNSVCDELASNNEFVNRTNTKAAGFTSFGDGEYTDDFGNLYLVDSASIGIMLVSEITDRKLLSKEMGSFFEFKQPFTVDIDSGVFMFGHIVIDTTADDEFEH